MFIGRAIAPTKEEIIQVKVDFAKAGLFNVKTHDEERKLLHNHARNPKKFPFPDSYWTIYNSFGYGYWYISHTNVTKILFPNRKVKALRLGNSNIRYRAHAVQRIIQRHGNFASFQLPSSIVEDEWFDYLTKKCYINTQNKTVSVFAIPFLSGLLIGRFRGGYAHCSFNLTSKQIKEDGIMAHFDADTFINDLTGTRLKTLELIKDKQYDEAYNLMKTWCYDSIMPELFHGGQHDD